MAVQDAVVTAEVLDQVLDLADRWPEPRALNQTEIFFMPDRTCVVLADLDVDGARALLKHLHALDHDLYAVAVRHEVLTTSTARRWAMGQAGVPRVEGSVRATDTPGPSLSESATQRNA